MDCEGKEERRRQDRIGLGRLVDLQEKSINRIRIVSIAFDI